MCPLYTKHTIVTMLQVIVVFCDEAAADVASEAPASSHPRCESCFLGDAFDVELEGTLLLVAPTASQVHALCRQPRSTHPLAHTSNPVMCCADRPGAEDAGRMARHRRSGAQCIVGR